MDARRGSGRRDHPLCRRAGPAANAPSLGAGDRRRHCQRRDPFGPAITSTRRRPCRSCRPRRFRKGRVGPFRAPMSRRRRQSAPPSLRVGRYIFVNASCALCHGNDCAGGLKVNGGDFGTVFVANLTSDRDTGLGAWSDAEIARAIRSGVSRDGRPLFWQGMPWGPLLQSRRGGRRLRHRVSTHAAAGGAQDASIPPSGPDDCPIYTFWTVPQQAPGCR